MKKLINNKAGVSGVIAVVLMVAITVALSSLVYVMVSGMLSTSNNVTPNIAFMQEKPKDQLIVTSVSGTYDWEDFNVTCSGTIKTYPLTLTGTVKAGDIIGTCVNETTITYAGTNLLGTWEFP